MALQVWLPLNGNLENKGLTGNDDVYGEYIIHGTGGKISSSFLSQGILTALSNTTKKVFVNGEYSVGFWIKVLSTCVPNGIPLLGQYDVSTSNNTQIFQFNINGVSDGKWKYFILIKNENGESNCSKDTSFSTDTVGTCDVWQHFTFTVSKSSGTVKIYLNGELINSAPISGTYRTYYDFNFNLATVAYTYSGYLNDLRVYDHCLSAAEVKEISKGLVIHYPLNQPGRNLLKGMYSCTETHTTHNESGYIGSISSDIILANKGRTMYFSADIENSGEYESDENPRSYKYDRFGAHGIININGSIYYPLTELLTVGRSAGRYVISWTIPSDVSSCSDLTFAVQTNGITDEFARPTATNTKTWYFKNLKLEWDCATPYIPYDTEEDYSIEYDCSGYGNHGTLVDTLSSLEIRNDSIRYDRCYYMGEGNVTSYATNCAYIQSPLLGLSEYNTCTVALWVKTRDHSSGTRSLFALTDISGSGHMSYLLQQFDGTVSCPYPSVRVNIDECFKVNEWHHLVIVFDNGLLKSYVDSILVDSKTSTSNVLDTIQYLTVNRCKVGGLDRRNPGCLSDFRLYATALSASDVKELYDTGAKVLKNGTLMCYEIKEV